MIYPIVESGEREIDDDDGVLPAGINVADAEFSAKHRSSYTRSCVNEKKLIVIAISSKIVSSIILLPELYRISSASIFSPLALLPIHRRVNCN